LKHAIKNEGEISPTLYEQLLRPQILKAQKKILKLVVFFALLRSACAKAARRTLMKLTHGGEKWNQIGLEKFPN
jgi:hypothetical protein